MQQIPSWIMKIIKDEKLTCNRCKGRFKVDNLMSIGIQESSREPHNDTLCIGMFCPGCKDLTIFELKEMALIEFAFEIMEQETDDKIKKRSKKSSPAILKKPSLTPTPVDQKSRITLRDVQETAKFLETHNHEDCLSAMGFSKKEIEKYSYHKPKTRK